MNRKTLKQIALLALAAALTFQGAAVAQPDDEEYRQQYARYQEAVAVEGAEEKSAALIDFLKEFPKSKLNEYIVGEYHKLSNHAYSSGNYRQAITLSAKFLPLYPNDFPSLYFSAESHFRLGDYKKSVGFAEKLLKHSQASADVKKQATFILAYAGVQSGDKRLVLAHGDQAIAAYGPDQTFSILVELMRHHFANDNVAKAAVYAPQALKGLEANKAKGNGAQWKKYVDDNMLLCHVVLGHSNFQRERWSEAIREFRRVLTMTQTRALIGEAYYNIGMSFWKMNKVEPEAMQAFARGFKRGVGEHANACQKYLEDLYKSRHNGSTAGLDEFIESALNAE